MPDRRPVEETHDPTDLVHYRGAVLAEAMDNGWLGWMPGCGFPLLHLAADAEHRQRAYRKAVAEDERLDLEGPALPAAELEEGTRNLEEVWRQAADDRGLPLDTVDDLIDVMAAIGLLELSAAGCVQVVNPLPLVEDALPLDEEQRQREVDRRWRARYERTAECIIARFGEVYRRTGQLPDGWQQTDTALTWTTTLMAASADLVVDPDDLRHGLALLLEDGELTIDVPDIRTVDRDQAFCLTIQWVRPQRGSGQP